MNNVKNLSINDDLPIVQQRRRTRINPNDLSWAYVGDEGRALYGREIIANTGTHFGSDQLFSKLVGRVASINTEYDKSNDYTSRLNAWLYSNNMVHEKTTQRQYLVHGRRVWEYERIVYAAERILKGYGISSSMVKAKHLCDYAILAQMEVPIVQMDGDNSKESNQGLTVQESDQQGNTIVTRDEGQTKYSGPSETKAVDYCSSEPIIRMPQVTERWMPLDPIEVKTSDASGSMLKVFYIPETLFKEMGRSVNLLPFESFIYGRYDVTMKFIVNANRFQCGKVLVSVKFDSYQADEYTNSLVSGLCRPHIILDLASNAEGQIEIPFRYHRCMLRNVKNSAASVGVRPSKFASVYLQILSPLSTGAEGANNMYIRPMALIKNAEFAGMSYRATVQMDIIGEALKVAAPTPEVRAVLATAERMIKTLGNVTGRDKPSDLKVLNVVPRPRMNFTGGKGLTDVLPMRLNPYGATTFTHASPCSDEPKTALDVAQIWGLRSSFKWSASNSTGQMLYDMTVDPSVRDYKSVYAGEGLTPLEYMAGMYRFWAGTIEVRLDFVSNAFHTGTVMLTAEYNRPSNDMKDAASCYTKTFHLGEQRTVDFTIPYISDTVWRRCNTASYNVGFGELERTASNEEWLKNAMDIRADSKVRFRIRVVNELRPVAAASQEIEVLVYWRASPEFMFHGLKQSAYRWQNEDDYPHMDNFPFDGYDPTSTTVKNSDGRSRRELTKDQLEKHRHNTPVTVANEWNEKSSRAYAQMDRGDKEDQDDTDDFRIGRFNLPLQTTDSHVSFNDILKGRPVMLIHHKQVDGYSDVNKMAMFIPLCPPSKMMSYAKAKDDMIWNHTASETPQAAIMNMFRFWRGSMRYTIVVESDVAEPVYVTYIPHSGTRLIGNRFPGKGDKPLSKVRPLAGTGLATEMIIPRVNPTCTVEVPYETENDWTLTFEEDALRNYSWRDKGDTVAGHLAISCHSNCYVTVWWSAGDDFEIANFYGIPKGQADTHVLMYDDAHARVQMEDFPNSENTYVSGALRTLKSMALPAGLSCIPGVGPALAVSHAAVRAETILTGAVSRVRTTLDNVDGTLESGNVTLQKITELAETCKLTVEDLKFQVLETLRSIINSANLLPTVKIIVESLIFDLVAAFLSRSWIVVGCGIIKVVYQVLGGTTALFTYGDKLASAIRNLFEQRAVAQDDREVTIVGLFCAIVGSILGVTLDSNSFIPWHRRFLRIFTTASGVSYMNQVMRFIKNTFECLKDMILSALGMVDPEVKAIKVLCSSSALIREFVTNAQICMNEANTTMMLAPAFRLKFWHTTLRAYQIQKVLCQVGNNIATPQLAKLCAEVIKTSTEKFVDLSCSPVRYVPYVICIEGLPDTGKSHLSHCLARKMLEAIGFSRPTAGPTYTRSVGSKFWSSYRDQPVILYDDWLNLSVTELVQQQVSELFQLKTPTRFIPEMAHLEEKRLSANPHIVILVCNKAFPFTVSNVAITPEAVYRRRDMVIKVELKEEFKGKDLREFARDDDKYEHLEFQLYRNAKSADSLSPVKKGFNEFLPWFLAKYQRYHALEQRQVRKRLDDMASYMKLAPGEMLGDPFELLYTAQEVVSQDHPTAWLPSEQLEMAVNELVTVIERSNEREEIIIPEEPIALFQDESVWWQIIKITASGVIATPSFWGWLVESSMEQLGSLLTEWPSTILTRGYCCVCRDEDVDIIMSCPNSTSETSHALCLTCLATYRNTSPRLQCPMCQSGILEYQLPETAKWWMVAAHWIVKKGRQYIAPLVHMAIRIMKTMPIRAYNYICLLSSIARTVFCPDIGVAGIVTHGTTLLVDNYFRPEADVWHDAESAPVLTASTIFTENVVTGVFGMTAQPQADVEVPGQQEGSIPEWEEEVTAVMPVESVFDNIQFRSDLLSSYHLPSQNPCLHKLVFEQYRSVTYHYNPETRNNYWKVVVSRDGEIRFAQVEDGWCSDACPFRNEESVQRFHERFVTTNKMALRMWIISVYNKTGVASIRAKENIPRLLRPEWMEPIVIETFNESWWEYLTGVYEKYKTFINICLAIVSMTGTLIGMAKLWNSFAQPVQQGDLNYNAADTRQLRSVQRRITTRPERVNVQAELHDVLYTKIERNYVAIKVIDDNGDVRHYMIMLGICGRWAITPSHYLDVFRKWKNNLTIEPAILAREKNHMATLLNFDECDVREIPDMDLACIKLPASYPMFKDIRKFVQKEVDLESHLSSKGVLVLAPTRKRVALLHNVKISGLRQTLEVTNIDDTERVVRWVVVYDYSEAGACGSVLMTETDQRPIKSMHIAGTSSGVGYGSLLTQELLEQLIDEKVVLQCEEVEFEDLEQREDVPVFDMETNVEYLGALPRDKAPFVPKKSKIKPSVIAPLLPPSLTQPAILHKGDKRYKHERSPLWYGCKKHGTITKNFRTSELINAREALWDMLYAKMEPCVVQPKRLTPEEAVVGKKGLEFYDPMKLDTSAGYPWQLDKQGTTKRAWCTLERNVHGDVIKCELRRELLDEIKRKEKLRKQAIVPTTIFVDTLKDERRKEAKLMKKGGTRVFCASPVDYTIATRQNLLHFCAAFMSGRHQLCHAVGINARGPEWTEIHDRLAARSFDNIVTMDYSNFGPAFNAGVAEMACDIMVRWTLKHVQGTSEKELRSLLYECINSVHAMGGLVYRQFAGSPSGAAITTVINTLVNQLYLTLAWRALCKDQALQLHSDLYSVFLHHVELVAYGDDFILSVSDMFSSLYNARTLQGYFAKYGIVATAAEKELVDIPAFVKLSEATFLKRGFKPHPKRKRMILGPLDLGATEDIPKWIWQSPNHDLATRVNVESALLEAHAHGPSYFEEKKNEYNEALKERGIQTISMQWDLLDEQWFKGLLRPVDLL